MWSVSGAAGTVNGKHEMPINTDANLFFRPANVNNYGRQYTDLS